jgi:outer membrane biogenesis lipoprotein LolB
MAYMWKSTTAAAASFLLAGCAEDKEQLKAQTEETAKAVAQAAAQIAQQDDARCQSYGKPGSAAYIDCRSSLKNDRAAMQK